MTPDKERFAQQLVDAGYQYGEDAMENAFVGYGLAQAEIAQLNNQINVINTERRDLSAAFTRFLRMPLRARFSFMLFSYRAFKK